MRIRNLHHVSGVEVAALWYEPVSLLTSVYWWHHWRHKQQMDNDVHIQKKPFKGTEMEYSSVVKSVPWSWPNRAWFSVIKDKTEGRKVHKPAATESVCLLWRQSFSRRKLRILWFPWAQDLRQLLTAKDFPQVLKMIIIFNCFISGPFWWIAPNCILKLTLLLFSA